MSNVIDLPKDKNITTEAERIATDFAAIYSAFRSKGFSDQQAFELLLQVIS